jgi:hypothetical protein
LTAKPIPAVLQVVAAPDEEEQDEAVAAAVPHQLRKVSASQFDPM